MPLNLPKRAGMLLPENEKNEPESRYSKHPQKK